MTEQQKQKNIEYWRQGSEKDLKAAVDIARLAHKNSHSLFFLHLSIEKAMKALFVFNNSNFAPLTHNLLALATHSKLVLDSDQTELIAAINDFNLQTRYPNEIDELERLATAEFTERHLNDGEKIQKWILGKLK